MGKITEDASGLRFTFPDSWSIIAYDDQQGQEYSFFKERLNSCLSGVDFLATSADGPLLLIEVKNFMGDRWNHNEYRFSDVDSAAAVAAVKKFAKSQKHAVKIEPKKPSLAKEFAKNVADTLLGLLSAHREKNEELAPFARNLVERRAMQFIWVIANDQKEFKRLGVRLAAQIKQNLAFIDGGVQVIGEPTQLITLNWTFKMIPPIMLDTMA